MKLRQSNRIAIIGGGPAGCIAALDLARAGARVDLFEPKGAWEKPCAGAVTPKVRDRIPEIRQLDRPFREVTKGIFISPNEQEIQLDSKRPLWILPRKDFNGFLFDLALSKLDVIWRKERVKRIEKKAASFAVFAESEREYDFILGCDGARSVVRRNLAIPIPQNMLAACKGYYIEAEIESKAITQFAPFHGYFWAFPRPDHICIGGGTKDRGVLFDQMLNRFIQRHFHNSTALGSYAGVLPAIDFPEFYDQPFCEDQWALCGDAAGFVDSITGEGIPYALESGREAAAAMIEGNLANYRDRVMDTFGGHLRGCAQLSKWIYRKGLLDLAFQIAKKSKSLRDLLITIMSDQPEISQLRQILIWNAPRILREISWK